MENILLINPGCNSAVYQALNNKLAAIEPPAFAGLFATYLRNKNCRVDIVDAAALNLSPQQVAEFVSENYNPDLIVLVVYGFQPSASTQNMVAAGEICSALKTINKNYKIIMTGTHIAALPDKTLREENIDFVCSGEGPKTILLTAQAIAKETNNFSDIPSLWYKAGDKIIANPRDSLMENLDEEMPGIAWDLLPMDKYRAHNWHCFENINSRQPYASMHTSLGCPYNCSFCCIHAPFGKPCYRMWKPETVIKEIDVLVNKYGVRNIKFIDEMFVLHKPHVFGICDLIIERGYDLNIWAYARIDSIKDEFLDKLNRAGIRWLALGIESGSKYVRDGVSKGRFSTEDVIDRVKKIQSAGINVIGNYMFGLPDDTFESMQETLDLAMEINCEFANFYCAMAYPGSQLYTMAVENNLDLPDSWLGYSQHGYETLPLRTKALSAAEVLQFRDDAFIKYFTNKQYLAMIKNKFGHDAFDHVCNMTKVKLKRKLLGD